MIREQVSIDDVIALLNQATELDRAAISALLATRVPCNRELSDHPTIQSGATETGFEVGILGVLNGIFGTDERGWGPIAALVEPDLTTVIRFERAPQSAERSQK